LLVEKVKLLFFNSLGELDKIDQFFNQLIDFQALSQNLVY